MDTVVEVMSMVTVLCMIFMYMFQWQIYLTLLKHEKAEKESIEILRYEFWTLLEVLLMAAVAYSNALFLF
jgi:ABC-type Fe3+-siderophore transport system permease subunit